MLANYFSYREAMNYMGIKSKSTFSKYLSNGLPTIQVGNSKRISKAAIDKFMADHTVITGQDTKAAK
ncbi:DNA-binding protein [Limosilactobacillus ingluviei]|uniref:DNA-binding protein n=1 Tax=Limosilactobacillus ingluviei TaxID=148604 RepID=UPI0024B8A9C5|nr:DNA-binding protein [Limosilactobacillus ingluviei]